jgi:flagellar basal body P-ring formation protein FlgA
VAFLLLAAGIQPAFSAVSEARSEKVPIRVSLAREAFVVGPSYFLGEVADVKGTDETIIARLRRMEIGAAPSAGRTVKLTPSTVRVVLRKNGFNRDILVEGAEETIVTTSRQELDTAELLPAIKSLVVNKTGQSPEDVSVVLGSATTVVLPSGVLTTRIKPPHSGKYEGSQLFMAEMMVDGRLAKTQPLRATVDIQASVVVARARIERGEKLTAENVGVQKVSTSKAGTNALRVLSSAVGRTAGRMMVPGTVIQLGDLSDPPAVRRNASVAALVRFNNVELTVDAKALDDGKVGQVIRIQNATTGKIFKARVVDEKNVEVIQAPKR